MGSVLIDNEWLSASLPDGFEAVPHNELEAFMGFKYDRMWGVRDTAHDALICVTWRDSNKLVMRLASEKFFAKQVDETFSTRYRRCAYHRDSFFSRAITGADNAAQGLCFSYAPDGVRHKGEVSFSSVESAVTRFATTSTPKGQGTIVPPTRASSIRSRLGS